MIAQQKVCAICGGNMNIMSVDWNRFNRTAGYAYKCTACDNPASLLKDTMLYRTRASLEDIVMLMWWYSNVTHDVCLHTYFRKTHKY